MSDVVKLNRYSVQKLGEHLVALECYKRNWTCSIVSGTQPDFDVLIHAPDLLRSVNAEIKTLQCSRKMTPPSGTFTKTPERTTSPLILVIYNRVVDAARFFIIPVHEIKTHQTDGGEEYLNEHPKWRGRWWLIRENYIEFEDRWDLLWESNVDE